MFLALFTIGYLFGVFITLKVFVAKESVADYRNNVSKESIASNGLDSWQIHTQLIEPNTPSHEGAIFKSPLDPHLTPSV